jgi:methylisocitrate lyase
MPYLVADHLPQQPAGERFRALLDRPGILQMPGTHNGMAALQAKAAGFEACYLSGAAMTASMGLPDLGVITVDEVWSPARPGCRCWWTATPATARR